MSPSTLLLSHPSGMMFPPTIRVSGAMTMSDIFDKATVAALEKPLDEKRVKKLRGNSYLESWDVIAHLNGLFGYGSWSTTLSECVLTFEEQTVNSNGNKAWNVAYRIQMALTVQTSSAVGVTGVTSFEDGAVGTSEGQPSRGQAHDQALKTAISDALKRCARHFGQQFGLSLYNDGALNIIPEKPEFDWPISFPVSDEVMKEAKKSLEKFRRLGLYVHKNHMTWGWRKAQ